MTDDRRITKQTEDILHTIMSRPTAEWSGAEIARVCGLKGGTIYPALIRMHGFGWLSWRWEEIDPSEEKRPRKRFYRLTADGERVASQLMLEAPQRERRRQSRQRLKPAPGGLRA
jgi:PadR family transcriptional regulator PadR